MPDLRAFVEGPRLFEWTRAGRAPDPVLASYVLRADSASGLAAGAVEGLPPDVVKRLGRAVDRGDVEPTGHGFRLLRALACKSRPPRYRQTPEQE